MVARIKFLFGRVRQSRIEQERRAIEHWTDARCFGWIFTHRRSLAARRTPTSTAIERPAQLMAAAIKRAEKEKAKSS